MRKFISRLWLRIRRRLRQRISSPEERDAYIRLVRYLQESMGMYKEMMEFLLERMKGRKEYWQGHAAGLKTKPPSRETLIELQIAQARLEELSRFLDWLEVASSKLNDNLKKVGDKLEEEIRRRFL